MLSVIQTSVVDAERCSMMNRTQVLLTVQGQLTHLRQVNVIHMMHFHLNTKNASVWVAQALTQGPVTASSST